jgi:MraZ protein
MRGSALARIDDKGRLKIPAQFRAAIEDGRGPDVFVTSITGLNVRIYPMYVWLEVERKLASVPSTHPTRIKFLDRVNYYGQVSELDAQGRVVIPQHLRESASIVGDVKVFGAIDYLEVWNGADFKRKLDREPWTDEDGLKLAEFLV